MKTPSIDHQREAFQAIAPDNTDDALRSLLWHFFRVGAAYASTGSIPDFDAEICRRPAYQLVPPAVIWGRWSKVKKVFGNKLEAWMRLIRIAAAGEEGLTHKDLFPNTNGWTTLEASFAAGIIEKRPVKDRLNRTQYRIVITRKGLDFLRMTAAQPRQCCPWASFPSA